MMKALLAILVLASPFVYWLLRRDTRSGAGRRRDEKNSNPDTVTIDQHKTAAFETQAMPSDSLPQEKGDPAVADVAEETGVGQAGGIELAVSVDIEPRQGSSTYRELEPLVVEDSTVEPVPVAIAETVDHLPSSRLGQGVSIPLTNPIHQEPRVVVLAEAAELRGSDSGEEAEEDVIGEAAVTEQLPSADGSTAEFSETTVPFQRELPRLSDCGLEDAEPSEPEKEHLGNSTQKAPARYRPPVHKPSGQAAKRPVHREAAPAVSSEVALDIRVRLTLDRFGFCAITFLPGRTAELDDKVAVRLGTTSLVLIAQEDWYQDLSFSDAGRYLHDGFELKGLLSDQRRARWILRGRDIYVLAAHPRASGFVSATRLAIGRSDIVLCGAGLAKAAEAVLKEAGCEGYSRLDETHGLPSGWAGFRGVSPVRAVALDAGTSDPLYAIKPAAEIEIEFEAGVWLRNSVWLAGHPPQIRVFGQTSGGPKVLIDGKEAQLTAEGTLVADGYDVAGPHFVYCEGLSRSYSIEEPPDSWETWPAYQFGEALICGASVQSPPEESGRRAFSVPMSNPLLIGAEPGQVFRCSSRSVAIWKGFVPFDVVWALPAQPLICNKKTARILQFSDKPLMPRRGETRLFVWSSSILDASRKGLRIEGGSPESTVRWAEYKKMARSIWRSHR